MANPRFEKEDDIVGALVPPDIDRISCKHCELRAKDSKIGDTVTPGAILFMCDVYDIKPPEIMDDYEKCPYFIDEREEDD